MQDGEVSLLITIVIVVLVISNTILINWIYSSNATNQILPLAYTIMYVAFVTRNLSISGQNTFMPVTPKNSLTELTVFWAANDSGGSARSDISYNAMALGF